MPLTEEHKRKMAEGRERAKQAKAAAAVAAGNGPVPETKAMQTAQRPPISTDGPRGIVPTMDEMGAMAAVYKTLELAGALPRDVPGDRGKPLTEAQAMALMLKGWELRLPPIQSMTGLYIAKDGVIAQKADLMRSQIQKSGVGLIVPEDMTDQKVTLRGIRYGVGQRPDRETVVSYDLHQLQLAGGLTEEAKKHPRGTLFARCTGELARGLFSDVLAGACYTPEELLPVAQGGPSVPRQPPGPFAQGEPESVQAKVAALPDAQKPAADPTPGPTPPQAQSTPPTQEERQPEASSSAPPTERTLTVAFPIVGKGGVIEEMRTAGITKPIMEAVLALAHESPDLTNIARGRVAVLGQKALRYLTNEEGTALLVELQAFKAGKPNPGEAVAEALAQTAKDSGSAEQALRALAAEYKVDPDLVLRTVASSFDKDDVSQLTMAQGQQACREMRHAAKDPEAFALLLARAAG